MKTLIKTTLTGLVLTFGTLHASGSHDHGTHGHSHTQEAVSKEDIQKVAQKQLLNLISKGKIAKSWLNKDIITMEKKQFHHNKEWVVSFNNKKIIDQTKQTLYIFISLYGKIIASNHTGK
jgi:isopropylmalate/homocitrate/citramalate synthase